MFFAAAVCGPACEVVTPPAVEKWDYLPQFFFVLFGVLRSLSNLCARWIIFLGPSSNNEYTQTYRVTKMDLQ